MINNAIGIDLGTTNSLVGIWRNNKVEIIQNNSSSTLTPSFVSFANNNYLIGEAAKNNLKKFPESTIYDIKRLIGRRFKDDSVQHDISLLTYNSRIKEKKNGRCEIEIKELKNKIYNFSIEQITGMILSFLKKNAEEYMLRFDKNIKIKDAVITVPAYFTEVQKQATKDAAVIAGLNVLRIINEPTAAAIAYKKMNPEINKSKILIFDLGGGTLDVSIVSINENDISVLATKGISHLGGIDFDKKILDFCIDYFKKNNKIDLSNEKKAITRLKNECETAKKNLSSAEETTINIENIYKGIDFNLTITRIDFENISKDLFKECMKCVEETLEIAKLKKEQIDNIVKIGGSSRIPKIGELLKKFFGKEILNKNININPDEAVAYGAAYQAASINGDFKDDSDNQIILFDIIGISLGYDNNGEMEFIFSNITSLPNRKSIILENKSDNKEFNIKVFQGENKESKKNYFLKDFIIYNSKKNDKYEIRFEIDVNSILHVFAKKCGTTYEFQIDEKKILSKKKIDELKEMCEKELELQNLNNEKEKATNVKCKLMEQYLEKYNKNKNPIAYNIINYLKKNPNETAETYEETVKEMDINSWIFD